ncbi:MAG: hypothetical protein WC829_04535 [Hyphomicrobium sp.]|jgi:hypothetical protein
MTTLATLTADVSSYTQYDNADFVSQIPTFIRSAEERVWYFVQLPFFRKAQTGTMTSGNPYLQLPADFLAPSSLSITVPVTLETIYLLNKDVEYIREVYPYAATTGVPFCYALFDADEDDTTIIIGPTPGAAYACQLNYFYRPVSLTTDSGGTWLSNHAYDTLLYGTLVEAANWMKRETGIDAMADVYEQRFIVGLQGLKNLGESRDRKDTYRSGEKRKAESI